MDKQTKRNNSTINKKPTKKALKTTVTKLKNKTLSIIKQLNIKRMFTLQNKQNYNNYISFRPIVGKRTPTKKQIKIQRAAKKQKSGISR